MNEQIPSRNVPLNQSPLRARVDKLCVGVRRGRLPGQQLLESVPVRRVDLHQVLQPDRLKGKQRDVEGWVLTECWRQITDQFNARFRSLFISFQMLHSEACSYESAYPYLALQLLEESGGEGDVDPVHIVVHSQADDLVGTHAGKVMMLLMNEETGEGNVRYSRGQR